MDQDREKLISNEQAKPTATDVNGIATFAVGRLAPSIAAGGTIHDVDPGLAKGIMRFQINASGASLVISVVCFFTSGFLHWTARRMLRNLQRRATCPCSRCSGFPSAH